jgi:hypothetical protein
MSNTLAAKNVAIGIRVMEPPSGNGSHTNAETQRRNASWPFEYRQALKVT